MAKPLLRFDDIVPETETIEIYGEAFPIMNRMDVGLRVHSQIRRLMRDFEGMKAEVEEIESDDDPRGDLLLQRMDERMDQVARLVMPTVTDAALAKLNTYDKIAIVEAFHKARTQGTQTTATRRSPRAQLTGAK